MAKEVKVGKTYWGVCDGLLRTCHVIRWLPNYRARVVTRLGTNSRLYMEVNVDDINRCCPYDSKEQALFALVTEASDKCKRCDAEAAKAFHEWRRAVARMRAEYGDDWQTSVKAETREPQDAAK